MNFQFYCDESYDGPAAEPATLTISGFFSNLQTWSRVEAEWKEINNRYGISCFHATDLNGGWNEYNKCNGWDRPQRISYSAELLRAINSKGNKLVAYNCGMKADEYRRIVNEDGRAKLGEPWFACFKTCIAMIAKNMETLPDDYQFSVVVEKGSGFDNQALGFFNRLKNNQSFPYRHRLRTCVSHSPEDFVGLQVADLMAYEYFKRLKNNEVELRPPLKLIREHNHYEEGYFGAHTLNKMKNQIESAMCGKDELVIIPNL